MSASSYKLLLNDFYNRTRELIDRCESEERIALSILKDYQKQVDTVETKSLWNSFQDVIQWVEMDQESIKNYEEYDTDSTYYSIKIKEIDEDMNVLKKNIKDLQTQLQSAYIRIKELNEELFESKNNDTDSTK